MKKTLLFVAIFMVTFISRAQITLSGVVKDSIGDPLEMANIIAINKETKKMASYGFSDAKGFYKLNLSKNATYNIKVSYVGMKSVDVEVVVKDVDVVKNIVLNYDNTLDEINIVSKMPVTIKGDTIVYNADSFKNGTERKLEDILKKLPGVEVNADGDIEIEGKKVEKLMVDGKDFFDGDTKLATKNIPSNAVDKIQVLRNFGDVGQLRGVQDNQDRIAINIKLKEGKKNFWFGDITLAAGESPSQGLYLFQPKLFYYNPKYSINFIGDINNLGELALNNRDIRNFSGGFRSQSPNNGTNINLGDNGLNLNTNARNVKEIETKLSAVNFTYSPSKKLDLSGFIIYSNNQTRQENLSTTDYVSNDILDDVTRRTTNESSDIGLFKFSANYKKDINSQLNYDILGRFSSDERIQNVNSLVLSDIAQANRVKPFKLNQNLSYFYTASEKSIFALEAQYVIQDEDPFYNALLENDPNNNNDPATQDGFDDAANTLGLIRDNLFYNINDERRVKSNQADVKLDYYYIINDVSNFNFVAGTIYSRQNFDSRFFQILDDGSTFNPTPNIGVTNPRTTNDTEYTFNDFYVGVRYRLRSGIFTITPGFTAHSYRSRNTQYTNEFFEDKFTRLLPEFNMVMQFKRSENLRFSYRQQVNFTDVNQIARGIVANDYDSFFFGNSDLINATSHNLNLNYFSFNLFNYSNVNAGITYNKTIDAIRTDSDFDQVVSTSTSINSPFEDETFNARLFLGKTFKKIRTRIGGAFNYSKFFQFLNDEVNTNIAYTQTYFTSFGTNFQKAPNVSLSYNLSYRDQDNSAQNFVNKSVNHAPSLSFDAYIWDAVTLKTDYTFNEQRVNGDFQNSFKIWNASLAYRKNRDAKWEYEVRASNILGTDSRIAVNNNNFAFSVNETFILPRLITFRMIYSL